MPLSMLPSFARVYLLVVSGLFGMVMGSALNCLAYRIARHEPWSRGRSHCPRCGHTLSAMELIPVFSWVLLRGRCRWCKEPISVRYPLTELFLGVLFALVMWKNGLTLTTVTTLILCGCLFVLSLVDLEVQLIPDGCWILPAAVRLAQLVFEYNGKLALLALLRGAGVFLALLLLSLLMDRVLHKESMGGGDIKLLGMLGIWFSLPACLLLLLLSCLIGLLFAAILVKCKRSEAFPFGPSIALAAVTVQLFGEPILQWYLQLFPS